MKLKRNNKSFTLTEILTGAGIFVILAIMGTAIISSAASGNLKVRQIKPINESAQKIINEIDKTIRDGNSKKQVYICSYDPEGQLVEPWWNKIPSQNIPNDFIEEPWEHNGPADNLRYNPSVSGLPWGELIGSRRFGNVLQIVELKDNTPPDADIGWHTQYPIAENYITKITQFSLDYTTSLNTVEPGYENQVVRLDLNIPQDPTKLASFYYPCRNLAFLKTNSQLQTYFQTSYLLNKNVTVGTLDLPSDFGSKYQQFPYFLFVGCDDLKANHPSDTGNERAYPDLNGSNLSCPDDNDNTLTGQSLYGPIIRITFALDSRIAVDNLPSGRNQTTFRSSFQTRRISGN